MEIEQPANVDDRCSHLSDQNEVRYATNDSTDENTTQATNNSQEVMQVGLERGDRFVVTHKEKSNESVAEHHSDEDCIAANLHIRRVVAAVSVSEHVAIMAGQ